MPSDEVSVADQLYYGIKSLPGWYEVLQNAENPWTAVRYLVGSLISAVILAGGEQNTPVAVSGELDANLTGDLTVMYPAVIVTVMAERLHSDSAHYEVHVSPLSELSEVAVESQHSFYEGTSEIPRHRGFAFSFVQRARGKRVRIAGHARRSPLTDDSAIYAAFTTIRDALTS